MNVYRFGWLICLLALAIPGLAVSDPAALRAQIDAKSAEVQDLEERLDRQEGAIRRLAAELERERVQAKALEQQQADALSALKAQFERVVADPSLDLAAAQQDYRQAFDSLATHRDAIDEKERRLRNDERRADEMLEAGKAAVQALAVLRAGFDRSRAERLLEELNVVGEISLSSTITCTRDETIGACIARGEEEARQLARERFGNQVLAAVTEADVVARHRVDESLVPTLIDSTIVQSGFKGQGDYFVELSARLRNESSTEQACRLLGLTEQQCEGKVPEGAATTASASAPEDQEDRAVPEDAAELAEESPAEDDAEEAEDVVQGDGQYRLTVRSNVYYDEVFIDGIAYGSTKLDVMLPAGEYDVEVRKPGHESYQERVSLSDDRTVTASLAELAQ